MKRLKYMSGEYILATDISSYNAEFDVGPRHIGVKLNSMGFFNNKDSKFIVKSITSNLRSVGLFPVLILPFTPIEYINAFGFEGIILTGGDDIDSRLSGTKSPSSYNKYQRDLNDIRVVQRFNGKVLGICRGLQIINIAFGGTLHNDIDSHTLVNKKPPSVHNVINHKINTIRRSMISRLGSSFVVPSSHHQSADKVGNSLNVTSYTDDVVESVEHKELPIFGFQFHPEFSNQLARRIFTSFL